MHREEGDVVKTKGGERRKSCWGMLIPLRTDSASYVWGPSMLASPHTVTGPRTHSRLSSATVWLFARLFVVIRKKKKKKKWRWGMFPEPGAGVWEHDWSRGLDLGERARERAGGPAGARGAWVCDWVWADLLCNVNPWGIRGCNRRGEVAARSLVMLTLCIPPP